MNVEDKIRAFIVENFVLGSDAAELTTDESLMNRGIVDSTGVLEIVAFLDGEFGFEVADEEILPENLDSIASIAAFVARKTG